MVDAPIGTESVPTAGGTVPAGAAASGAPAEPSIIDLDENALIRVKGSKDPVKFGEYGRGFQAQFTKASQRAAQLEKALQARDSELQRYKQEQQAAAARQTQAPGGDVYQALRELPYLSGKDAVEVVSAIGDQIRQRDLVLLGTLKQLQQMQQVLGGLHETSSSSAFDAKIGNWLQEGGYPPEAADLAKEIYLAYEGDDLDQEFPKIFEARWQQVEKLVEARRQGKIAAARRMPFLPGKGGKTGPSKPMEIPSGASSREVADLLYPMVGESET